MIEEFKQKREKTKVNIHVTLNPSRARQWKRFFWMCSGTAKASERERGKKGE